MKNSRRAIKLKKRTGNHPQRTRERNHMLSIWFENIWVLYEIKILIFFSDWGRGPTMIFVSIQDENEHMFSDIFVKIKHLVLFYNLLINSRPIFSRFCVQVKYRFRRKILYNQLKNSGEFLVQEYKYFILIIVF